MEIKKTGIFCEKSITLLKKTILENYPVEDSAIWADFHTDLSQCDEITDFYLFGSFLENALTIQKYKIKYKNIFVLCSAAKDILISILNIPEGQIIVINRYRLFPILQKPRIINTSQPITLYYAGRLSSAKNIDMLLSYFYFFEQNYSHSRLVIYGSYDNQSNMFEKELEYNYQRYIEKIIKKYDWITSPIFHGDVSQDTWVNDINNTPNAVYIDLSVFFQDDFNTSIALVQQLGVPVITTNLGGRIDLRDNIEITNYECLMVREEKSIHSNALYLVDRTQLILKSPQHPKHQAVKAVLPKEPLLSNNDIDQLVLDIGLSCSTGLLKKLKYNYMNLFSCDICSLEKYSIFVLPHKSTIRENMNSFIIPEYRVYNLKYRTIKDINIIYYSNEISIKTYNLLLSFSLQHNIELIQVNNSIRMP